jgi:Fe-S cluster biogenesis protein NfuA
MSEVINRAVNLYAEATPNPASMKFVASVYLAQGKSVEFKTIESSSDAPLAKALFSFPFIESVFISDNFVTVLKKEGEDWHELTPLLKDFIKNYLESGEEVLSENFVVPGEDGNEIEQHIMKVLNDYVRPAVKQDGGAIVFKKFEPESGVLTLGMQGACSGCPSSMITLKSGIENLMTKMVPEVKEVVAEQE